MFGLKRDARISGDLQGRICVMGTSHTIALQQAQKKGHAADVHVLNLNQTPRIYTRGGTALYLEHLDLTNPGLLALSVGGNQHAAFALLEHPRRYAVWPDDTPVAPGRRARTLIPHATMRAVLAERSANYFDAVRALRAHFADTPAVLVCPPPPLRNADRIMDRPVPITAPDHAPDRPVRIAPPVFRKTVYDIQVALTRALATEIGADFIAPPEAALMGEGFLAPRYAGRDATHCNSNYGKLVLDQLVTHHKAL